MSPIPPTSDLALIAWSAAFSAGLTADPGAYHLTPADAARYADLHAALVAARRVVDTPATRTPPAYAAKDAAKTALLKVAREYVKVIKALAAVTDQQRYDLGLPPRRTAVAQPAPADRPLLSVDPFGRVRLRAASGRRRGRPRGTIGAVVFAAVLDPAAPAPATPDDARYAGLATRDTFTVPLPPGAAGKVLYVLARYLNAKGDHGPVSAVARSRVAA